MNGQQDNIQQFGAEDILRYLSGKMDREETRIMERAMLDDELLADSVEGYKLMRETLSDEFILQKAGSLKNPEASKTTESPKVVSITSFRWLKYAAAACLVVAAGWWIFSITRPEPDLSPEMASTETTEIADSTPADLAGVKNEEQSSTKTLEADIPSTAKAENKKAGESKTNTEGASKDIASVAPAKTEGQVSTTLQAESQALDAKKEDADVSALSKRAAPMAIKDAGNAINLTRIDTTEAVPNIGWSTYKKYLENKLPQATINSQVEATIVLLANGTIEGVELKSILTDSEMQAIKNVIKTGPAWKNKSGKKARAILEWR